MNNILFDFINIRFEISFKSYDELRSILSFYQKHNLYKINIPCKSSLKKEFLLGSIKISREEFPNLDIIPHFCILHEFKRTRINTQESFYEFVQFVKSHGCSKVLLISGSQKRSSLDSVSLLGSSKYNPLLTNDDFSIGIAFNPYLSNFSFHEEIKRLKKKLKSGLVSSIWIQFGTDASLLQSRINILQNIILSTIKNNSKISDISVYGSILIPSRQFIARFKYRPWKGVYCTDEFLESVDAANKLVVELLKVYKLNKITPIIESNISTDDQLKSLGMLLEA